MIKFSFTIGKKLADLEAKLEGVNGFTGRGEVEFESWKNGNKSLEVELRGVAGRHAQVFANDQLVIDLEFDNGRLDHTFETRKGDAVPEMTEGALIEIRQMATPFFREFCSRIDR